MSPPIVPLMSPDMRIAVERFRGTRKAKPTRPAMHV
jgi:hypothetical protein